MMIGIGIGMIALSLLVVLCLSALTVHSRRIGKIELELDMRESYLKMLREAQVTAEAVRRLRIDLDHLSRTVNALAKKPAKKKGQKK